MPEGERQDGVAGVTEAPAVLEMRAHFETGLVAYRKRAYDDAKAPFGRALEYVPGDSCSQVFIRRLETMQRQPMPAGWDGIWQHTEK